MKGHCMSENTNRIWISVSGLNKTITIYPNTNTSYDIGPFEFSHSHGSQEVLISYVTGQEVNGRTITCRDINGGMWMDKSTWVNAL